MEMKKYIGTYRNTLFYNRFFRLLIVGLLFVIVTEGFLIFHLVGRTRILVVPAVVSKKFFVEADKASPDYILMMAEYAVDLMNTYTPKTVKARREGFLQLLAPEYYHTVASTLLADVKDIVKYDVTSVFFKQEAKLKSNKVIIIGVLKKWMGNKPASTRQMAYIVTYRIHQGRFEVMHYEEMDARDYYRSKSS